MRKTITNQYQSKVKKSSYKKYESRGDKDKKLSEKGYLFKIRPNLSNMLNDHMATIKLKIIKINWGNGKFNYTCM